MNLRELGIVFLVYSLLGMFFIVFGGHLLHEVIAMAEDHPYVVPAILAGSAFVGLAALVAEVVIDRTHR